MFFLLWLARRDPNRLKQGGYLPGIPGLFTRWTFFPGFLRLDPSQVGGFDIQPGINGSGGDPGFGLRSYGATAGR